jgi:hypothetical protein
MRSIANHLNAGLAENAESGDFLLCALRALRI